MEDLRYLGNCRQIDVLIILKLKSESFVDKISENLQKTFKDILIFDDILLTAAYNGSYYLTKYNMNSENIKHAFNFASENGHTNIVKFLMRKNEICKNDDDYYYAFRAACGKGHIDIVKEIYTNTADKNSLIHVLNESPLFAACEGNHSDVVLFLIDCGADIHVTNDYILKKVIEKSNFEVANILISNGLKITPNLLGYAIKNNNHESIKYIFLNITFEEIIIHEMFIKNWDRDNTQTFEILLENGLNIHNNNLIEYFDTSQHKFQNDILKYKKILSDANDSIIPDNYLNSVKDFNKLFKVFNNKVDKTLENIYILLRMSITQNDVESLKSLLDEIITTKIDVNLNKLLMYAFENKTMECLKILFDYGADVHYLEDFIFILAIGGKHLETVEFLLDKGVDPSNRNNLSIRVLFDFNSIYGKHDKKFYDLADLLISKGADINTDNNFCFSKALELGDDSLINYLVEKGANISTNDCLLIKQLTHYDIDKAKEYINKGYFFEDDSFIMESISIQNIPYEQKYTFLKYLGYGEESCIYKIDSFYLMRYTIDSNRFHPYAFYQEPPKKTNFIRKIMNFLRR